MTMRMYGNCVWKPVSVTEENDLSTMTMRMYGNCVWKAVSVGIVDTTTFSVGIVDTTTLSSFPP